MGNARRWAWGMLTTASLGTVLACGDDASPPAWNPALTEGPGPTSGAEGTSTAAGPGDSTMGEACEPGAVEPCLCPDGLSLGEQVCLDDGVSVGACSCDTETGDMGSSDSGDPMPPLPREACYLGANGAGTTCLPLVAFYADLPAGYEYPAPMLADGQDRPPLALFDVTATPGSTALAPNFALDELAQPSVGQWAVVQPHAVASLQAMRNLAGPISVVAGYLSPSANAAMGGELYARHQYGDGFDLTPLEVTVGELSALCTAEGGAVVEFESHLHCEFSAVPVDEAFFGPASAAAPGGIDALVFDAWIEPDGLAWWAPAWGFVEGHPRRQWVARDAMGAVLVQEEGRTFVAPPGTRQIEVLVGGRVRRTRSLAAP
ncbi:MAG: hypothetical protein K0V04_45450 [Deltaproteobacteria bacterium]|nr:hypothetical protein [Deltaproteobacteria bacterium]